MCRADNREGDMPINGHRQGSDIPSQQLLIFKKLKWSVSHGPRPSEFWRAWFAMPRGGRIEVEPT
jgi:hypothetical protein